MASWSNFLGLVQIFPSTQTEQNLGHFTNHQTPFGANSPPTQAEKSEHCIPAYVRFKDMTLRKQSRLADELGIWKTSQIGVFFDVLGTKQMTRADYHDDLCLLRETVCLFSSIEQALEQADMFHKYRSDQQEKDIERLDFLFWRFSDNIFFLSNLPSKNKKEEYEAAFEGTLSLFLSNVSVFFCHMIAKGYLTRGGMCMGDAVLNNEAVLGSALTNSYRIESSKKVNGGGVGVSKTVFDEFKSWANTTTAYGTNNSTEARQTFKHWFVEDKDAGTGDHKYPLLNIFHNEVLSDLSSVKIQEMIQSISENLYILSNASHSGKEKNRSKWIWTAAHLYFSLVSVPKRQGGPLNSSARYWEDKFKRNFFDADFKQIQDKSMNINYRNP